MRPVWDHRNLMAPGLRVLLAVVKFQQPRQVVAVVIAVVRFRQT